MTMCISTEQARTKQLSQQWRPHFPCKFRHKLVWLCVGANSHKIRYLIQKSCQGRARTGILPRDFLWGSCSNIFPRDLLQRSCRESSHRALVQRSCHGTSDRDLVQRPGEESSDLAQSFFYIAEQRSCTSRWLQCGHALHVPCLSTMPAFPLHLKLWNPKALGQFWFRRYPVIRSAIQCLSLRVVIAIGFQMLARRP